MLLIILSSHSPSISDFSSALYRQQELRRLFVDAMRSMQGNSLLSISLQASVAHMHKTVPLKGQCFDFTDGFKHSDLNIHFALKMSMQYKESKRERQTIVRLFSSLSYISKRRSPDQATRYFFLVV